MNFQTSGYTSYRLTGALQAEVMGRDLKGVSIRDVSHPEERTSRMERLWNLVSQPCGVFVKLTLVRRSGATVPVCRLLLPVSPQDPSEPMKIYGAIDHYGEPRKLDDQPVDLVALADEFDYIDIGCGTPD